MSVTSPPKMTARNHPAYMSLYPEMDSVVEVIELLESRLPITTPNELFTLLMTYHNTLIKEIHSGEVVQFPKRLANTKTR